MSENPKKINDDDVAEEILNWWHGLEEDRGGRAELRRCHSLTEVMFCPAFHRLYFSLCGAGITYREGIALIAGVLSHVKESSANEKFGKLMADKRGGNRSQVSEPRFQSLLRTTDRNKLFLSVVRIIGILGGTVNVCELSEILYSWNWDKTRRDLAFTYYEDVIVQNSKKSGDN